MIEACGEVDRDRATMRFSIAIHGIVGETRDEAMDRARAVYELRPRGQNFDDWFLGSSEQRLFGSIERALVLVDAMLFAVLTPSPPRLMKELGLSKSWAGRNPRRRMWSVSVYSRRGRMHEKRR